MRDREFRGGRRRRAGNLLEGNRVIGAAGLHEAVPWRDALAEDGVRDLVFDPDVEGDAEFLALIAQLDHSRFAVREDASRKLERLGPAVVAALKSALPKAASFEVATRIEQLLSKPGLRDVDWTPRELRILRLMRALEQIETREARDLLKNLPLDSVSIEMKEEGRLALERMDKRTQ